MQIFVTSRHPQGARCVNVSRVCLTGAMMRRKLMPLAGATLLLAACAVYPEYDPYPEPVLVQAPPPPPRIEYVGPPPAVGYVWIEGYWNWVGARYVWVPGRWVAPRPGYVWIPHRWERHGEQWRLHGGRWERWEPPRVVVPPPHQEHRPPPPSASPLPWPHVEPRPVPGIVPHPPERPPQIERESRRPLEVDPGQFPRRHATPPGDERDVRGKRGHNDRHDERRWRDRDGRPDFR
jgi:hypothetical protein